MKKLLFTLAIIFTTGLAFGQKENSFNLNESYPLNENGTIYLTSDDAEVTMRIFTLSGGLVLKQVFANGGQGGVAGLNEFKWDGRNGKGEPVASGGYILVIGASREGETLHTMRHKIAVVR